MRKDERNKNKRKRNSPSHRSSSKKEKLETKESKKELSSSSSFQDNIQNLAINSEAFKYYKIVVKSNKGEEKTKISSAREELRKIFENLERVTISDDLNYFHRSTIATKCASNFLKELWADKGIFFIIDKFYQDKQAQAKQKESDVRPSCLSFLPIEIGEEKFCLMAFSGYAHYGDELRKYIVSFVETYNKQNKPDYPLVLLGNIRKDKEITNIDSLLENISTGLEQKLLKARSCAEKSYIIEVFKLLALHGNQVKIKGAINCEFYPYLVNKKNKVPNTNSPAHTEELKANSQSYLLSAIHCCPKCQNNKPAVLLACHGAQQLASRAKQQHIVSYQLCLQETGSEISRKLIQLSFAGKLIKASKKITVETALKRNKLIPFTTAINTKNHQLLQERIASIPQPKTDVPYLLALAKKKYKQKEKYIDGQSKIIKVLLAKLLEKPEYMPENYMDKMAEDYSKLASTDQKELMKIIETHGEKTKIEKAIHLVQQK